jgi:hypothetical protein
MINTGTQKKEAPAELVAKAEEINAQWMGNTIGVVQPYLQDTDLGDEWRFRIIDRTTMWEGQEPRVLVEHLAPEDAHGHTYMLFVRALFDFGNLRAREGGVLAVTRMVGGLAHMANVSLKEIAEVANV